MAKLNVNFSEQTIRDEPTKDEIFQIEGLALSVKAIIQTLNVYASNHVRDAEGSKEVDSVCIGVCNALELLVKPIIEYLVNYAGDEAAPETTEETT